MTETAKVVPQLSLGDLLQKAHKQMETVVTTHGKLVAARVACGQSLLELRRRIEAGEGGDVKWWDWYGEHFGRSRRDAERVMELAAAKDPEAAHEAEKAATRERQGQTRIATTRKGQRTAVFNETTAAGSKAKGKSDVETPTKNSTKSKPDLRVVEDEPKEEPIREELIRAALAATEPLSLEECSRFLVQYQQQYRRKFG